MADAKVIILKAVGLALLLIVTIVGCNSHFNPGPEFKEYRDALLEKVGDRSPCQLIEKCPQNLLALEVTFVVITIICVIVSTLSLLLGLFVEAPGLKLADAGYHILAAIMLLIAGALILAAAAKVDIFAKDCIYDVKAGSCPATSGSILSGNSRQTIPLFDLKEFRKQAKFLDKLAAGILAFFNSLIYIITAAMVVRTAKE